MTPDVALRDVTEDDLSLFFYHQLDPDATQMAGFPARTKGAFMAHWMKLLADNTPIKKTIIFEGQVAGNIGSWEQDGEQQVGYWLGESFWGKGIATQALAAFLPEVPTRPLYAHVVKWNHASLRVLEKCGFVVCGEEGEEIKLILSGPAMEVT